jgi:hypothetical protein
MEAGEHVTETDVIVGITGWAMLKPPPQPDTTVKDPAVKRRVAKTHAIRRDTGCRPVLAIFHPSKKPVWGKTCLLAYPPSG